MLTCTLISVFTDPLRPLSVATEFNHATYIVSAYYVRIVHDIQRVTSWVSLLSCSCCVILRKLSNLPDPIFLICIVRIIILHIWELLCPKILIISQNLVLLCFSLLMTMGWRKRSCPHSLSQSHTWNLRGETRLLSFVHEKCFKFQRNRDAQYPCTIRKTRAAWHMLT